MSYVVYSYMENSMHYFATTLTIYAVLMHSVSTTEIDIFYSYI